MANLGSVYEESVQLKESPSDCLNLRDVQLDSELQYSTRLS